MVLVLGDYRGYIHHHHHFFLFFLVLFLLSVATDCALSHADGRDAPDYSAGQRRALNGYGDELRTNRQSAQPCGWQEGHI